MSQQWRKDFPTEWSADGYTTRREFTKFLIMISGATFFGNGYFVYQAYANPKEFAEPKRVAAVADLAVGEARLFRYPTDNDPAILIRLAEDEFVAYTQRCTHLSCPVLWAAETRRLECPCHDGAFDAATGRVLKGPPPRPLPRIALRVANGEIFAEGVAMA